MRGLGTEVLASISEVGLTPDRFGRSLLQKQVLGMVATLTIDLLP
jgi:hypothetical protein